LKAICIDRQGWVYLAWQVWFVVWEG
jgi:hypothetical protein